MVLERLPDDGEQVATEDRAWVIWLSCGGCEGCTMSVLGATSPRLEELLAGGLTHIPRVEFIHLALSLEEIRAGDPERDRGGRALRTKWSRRVL